MSSLSSLRSQLSYWNGQITGLNNKIKKLKARLKDVENVKKALQTTASGNSSDVNSKLRSTANKLDTAIDYSGKDGQLRSILSGKEEHGVGSDGSLTSADGELQREIRDINNKITEAENALASAKCKVSDIKSAITIEERRLREEAANKS